MTTLRPLKTAFVSALLALTLTGCVTSGPQAPIVIKPLPIPADIKLCFEQVVPAPPKGKSLNKEQVIRLIAKLVQSDATKAECGKRLIKFYEAFL